jgi:hypothetical protein
MRRLLGRTDAVCDQMVAQVNAAFVANGLEPLYKRKNLTNWFNNMSYKASLADHPTACDGPAVVEAAKGAEATLDRESMGIEEPQTNQNQHAKCRNSRSENKPDEGLLAHYKSTSGMKVWDEEEEMQRGVDFHLFPSLRAETREPVTPVDNVTREALMSKYNASLGPSSLPHRRGEASVVEFAFEPRQKATLLLKYESIELIGASQSGATRT